jgi:hypothetical protein
MIRGFGSRLASVVTLGGLLVIIHAGDLRAQGLKVVGYADLEWSLEQTGDPADEWHHFFDNHHFNIVAVGWIMDDLVATAEVEYEHAGEEIALEYGFLAYSGIRYLRIAGGKFLIPFNRFNKDLHPTWISKVPGRPLPYDDIFPVGYSDVGLWVSGGAPVGGGSRVVYDAYVVNGLACEEDEADFRECRDNDRDGPLDDNKALGGRLGLELAQGLGLGGSAYSGGYAEGLDFTFLGADADYHIRGLELRGEFVYAKQDRTTGEVDRLGFYLQGAYLLSDLLARAPNFEPVLRWSSVDFKDEDTSTQDLAVGLNYYISASSSVRAAWFFVEGSKNDRLVTQWNIAF